MQPGDVRTFEGERAITAAFGIWAEKRGNWIYINITGDNQNLRHVIIVNNPESVMYHRTLFRDLRQLLITHHKWPFGEEGSETDK